MQQASEADSYYDDEEDLEERQREAPKAKKKRKKDKIEIGYNGKQFRFVGSSEDEDFDDMEANFHDIEAEEEEAAAIAN